MSGQCVLLFAAVFPNGLLTNGSSFYCNIQGNIHEDFDLYQRDNALTLKQRNTP